MPLAMSDRPGSASTLPGIAASSGSVSTARRPAGTVHQSDWEGLTPGAYSARGLLKACIAGTTAWSQAEADLLAR